MEILETTTINNITLNVNDSWDIGNDMILFIKEIFSIEDTVYLALSLNNTPFEMIGKNFETKEETYRLSKNREFMLAEQFILDNPHLFNK
jgi:hypothetical protein